MLRFNFFRFEKFFSGRQIEENIFNFYARSLLDGKTKTNYSGGIQGGISNGNDLIFTTGFKPVSSIKIKQNMINSEGKRKEVKIEGKHDPCVVPRAVPIVESMTSMVILDYIF